MAVKALMVFLFLAVVCLIAESSASSSDAILGVVRASTPGTCNDLVGECINENDEFMMESDITRRFLFRPRRHISYGALKRNQVPCSRRGKSYYGCTRATRANPYRRGCSRITRCARLIR
ncbi:protein RALF-like 22 [Papaver somniferum]|uniref:protein RALF-like 22 n=1 Tax=Papaver somniferum TaxID=3469 RepID=UPI000E6F77AA|nr:protein RALF-like 22 [Papaver somniferum]